MVENQSSKKYIWLGLALAAVIAAVFLFFYAQARFASSYYQQGVYEFDKGNFAESLELFNRSLKYNSKNPEPHFYLGKIALGKPNPNPGAGPYYPDADHQEAIAHFEKSVSLGLGKIKKPVYGPVFHDLGYSYWMLKDHAQAEEKFKLHIEKYGQSSFVARYFLASHYFSRANKPQEALDILLPAPNQARSDVLKQSLFRVYVLLSRLYTYFKDAENAEKYARLSVQSTFEGNRDLDVQIAHDLLALAAGARGDFGLAEKEIAIANALAGSPIAHNCSLAGAYHLGKNYIKAIQIAVSRKKTTDYGYSICLRVLADSHTAQNNMAEAKKYMQEYLSLTDAFKEKNIFTVRDRERFQKELENLK